MQKFLNYKIKSEGLFKCMLIGDTYQFHIEIDDARAIDKSFVIAFQKNKNGKWETAARFGCEADESEKLISYCADYYTQSDKFIPTNLTDIDSAARSIILMMTTDEILEILNSYFAIIEELSACITE